MTYAHRLLNYQDIFGQHDYHECSLLNPLLIIWSNHKLSLIKINLKALLNLINFIKLLFHVYFMLSLQNLFLSIDKNNKCILIILILH